MLQDPVSAQRHFVPQRARDDILAAFIQKGRPPAGAKLAMTENGPIHMDKLLKTAAKSPIYLYRYAVSPVIGPRCRHLPTCSQYALDAIETNGIWIGGWLALYRIARCHPWGTSGYDPAPDLREAGIPFWMPWRYFRYRRAASEE